MVTTVLLCALRDKWNQFWEVRILESCGIKIYFFTQNKKNYFKGLQKFTFRKQHLYAQNYNYADICNF